MRGSAWGDSITSTSEYLIEPKPLPEGAENSSQYSELGRRVYGRLRASRVKAKMAAAVEIAALHGDERVDWALGHAASFGRFDDGDLASILAAHPAGDTHRASDTHSLQQGTSGMGGVRAMTVTTSGAADEVIDLLHQLRLPHMRRHARDMLATAKAQHWEPAEAVREWGPARGDGRRR